MPRRRPQHRWGQRPQSRPCLTTPPTKCRCGRQEEEARRAGEAWAPPSLRQGRSQSTCNPAGAAAVIRAGDLLQGADSEDPPGSRARPGPAAAPGQGGHPARPSGVPPASPASIRGACSKRGQPCGPQGLQKASQPPGAEAGGRGRQRHRVGSWPRNHSCDVGSPRWPSPLTPPGTPQVRRPDNPESGRGERPEGCRMTQGHQGTLGWQRAGSGVGRSASMWFEGLGPGVWAADKTESSVPRNPPGPSPSLPALLLPRQHGRRELPAESTPLDP